MFPGYHQNPIIGIYYYPKPDNWDDEQMARDLREIARASIRSIWLFYDPFYEHDAVDRLRALLDIAHQQELTVTPVLGQFLQLNEHPEVRIINADGTTSDDPRFWNMGCVRHPTVIAAATARVTGFLRDFGDYPALYRLDGRLLMSFVHEAYYRNSIPEFGGGPMHPSCYCDDCRAAFSEYLSARGLDPGIEPPREPSDPGVWQHWLDCHAEAIPAFLAQMIQVANNVTPVWATHELNDFYPASWQSVYTGNDWWRMAAPLDFGHEDMYPLEFDHRYQCYVYDYAKDVMRSAMNFSGLMTANGQAFNSWLGYRLPDNSMSEQIYSCLAHGALGLVWWGQWRDKEPEKRYALTKQTHSFNLEYTALVAQLEGCHLEPARIALLYSWTTMSQALNDEHTYDTLLFYMLLVQCGYPVDVLSEDQVARGVLQQRHYQALGVMGGSALPDAVHDAISRFVLAGGLVIADHAPHLNSGFLPLYAGWRGQVTNLDFYRLSNQAPVPIQLSAARLHLPDGAQTLAHYDNGSPAIAKIKQGEGSIILAGSYLGWDYSNYPGYYDLAAMFPFHVRRDDALRDWLADTLTNAGIVPPVRSVHPDVEVALWQTPDRNSGMLIAINHLDETVDTQITVTTGNWSARDALTGQPVDYTEALSITFKPFEGRAFRLNSA